MQFNTYLGGSGIVIISTLKKDSIALASPAIWESSANYDLTSTWDSSAQKAIMTINLD